jgi:hypothetical protein
MARLAVLELVALTGSVVIAATTTTTTAAFLAIATMVMTLATILRGRDRAGRGGAGLLLE